MNAHFPLLFLLPFGACFPRISRQHLGQAVSAAERETIQTIQIVFSYRPGAPKPTAPPILPLCMSWFPLRSLIDFFFAQTVQRISNK